MSNYKLEEGGLLRFDFEKLEKYFRKKERTGSKIVPVVVQDADSKEVLLLAYANEAVLRYSLENKLAAFWSTSRDEIWVKGLISGNRLELVEARVNCEQNSLLYLVRPINGGGACHTQENGQFRKSCFYRRIVKNGKIFTLERSKIMKTLGISKGTMEEPTITLLGKAGARVVGNGRNFNPRIESSDIFEDALILRPQYIPEALVNGNISAGILGRDWLEESGLGDKISILAELPFAKKGNVPARVVVFGKTQELWDKEGTKVASEYPNLARRIFRKAAIVPCDGGAEALVRYLGYDYGICVVETGNSLRDNGLVEVREIMVSPMLLVAPKPTPELELFGRLLAGTLKAEEYCLLKLNVSREQLNGTLKVLPALDSPTINSLSQGGFSVETVVRKKEAGNLIIALKKNGATGILVQELTFLES